MTTYRILCIDDDTDFLIGLRMQLKALFQVRTASSTEEGLAALRSEQFDLVIHDVELGDQSGIDGVKAIKKHHPSIDVVMLSGRREPKIIVEALRAGASDYLTKPFEIEELQAIVEKQAAARQVRERYEALVAAQNADGFEAGMIHRSASIGRILNQAAQLKGHQANVLIMGETGTGKELLARYIHHVEGVASRPFIAVNCAAIPENLIEAELFGVEPGSYTGAVRRRIGKFELADGGDIFLDEVAALKPDLQAKLLRVLQEREFSRVGGNDTIHADFRVISATNEPIEEKVSRGEFRMDLYHRLRVIQFSIPPLRDRTEDIPALVDHFLAKFAKNGAKKKLTAEAMMRLQSYHWSGNVRELANVIQGLVILTPGDKIDDTVFPAWALNGCSSCSSINISIPPPSVDVTVEALKDYISRAERQYIEHALRACDGDKSRAARKLDLGRTTLYGKMKDLGMM